MKLEATKANNTVGMIAIYLEKLSLQYRETKKRSNVYDSDGKFIKIKGKRGWQKQKKDHVFKEGISIEPSTGTDILITHHGANIQAIANQDDFLKLIKNMNGTSAGLPNTKLLFWLEDHAEVLAESTEQLEAS